MPNAVNTGCMMKCSFGAASSSLLATPGTVTAANMPMATIMDNKPMMNIPPFGVCMSLSNPQVAAATSAALGVLTPCRASRRQPRHGRRVTQQQRWAESLRWRMRRQRCATGVAWSRSQWVRQRSASGRDRTNSCRHERPADCRRRDVAPRWGSSPRERLTTWQVRICIQVFMLRRLPQVRQHSRGRDCDCGLRRFHRERSYRRSDRSDGAQAPSRYELVPVWGLVWRPDSRRHAPALGVRLVQQWRRRLLHRARCAHWAPLASLRWKRCLQTIGRSVNRWRSSRSSRMLTSRSWSRPKRATMTTHLHRSRSRLWPTAPKPNLSRMWRSSLVTATSKRWWMPSPKRFGSPPLRRLIPTSIRRWPCWSPARSRWRKPPRILLR